VRIEVVRTVAPRPPRSAACVYLETEDGSTALSVELEPALVTLVLARVLGRRPELTSSSAVLDDAARGALSAVLIEVARRAFGTTTLRARQRSAAPHEATSARGETTSARGETALDDALRVDATVFVDARPYHASLYAVADSPNAAPGTGAALEALGALPIALPVVAALSTAARHELAGLCPGDVWLPGAGWLGDVTAPSDVTREPFLGVLARAALSPPGAELGVEVGGSEEGRLVVRGGIIALGADVTDTEAGRGGGDETVSDETLTDLVLDAPVVVRVEVGSVTLSAREWASLRPGDVLETGLRLAEPAVLRVAGREVARGELVNVEGELGVRIREIIGGEPPE
jgi:flagellar motor switch/type III secretory pathway protein FliN